MATAAGVAAVVLASVRGRGQRRCNQAWILFTRWRTRRVLQGRGERDARWRFCLEDDRVSLPRHPPSRPPDLPPSRPPVRLIYRLCRARSERSSVVSLCLSSALHTISKADRAGQNPFASVSVCEEGEGWRAAAAAAWQPWYSLKGLVPRGNATDRGPRASWLLFTPRQQARVWQGESLEIGQDDRGASPSPPALPLLPTFAFA